MSNGRFGNVPPFVLLVSSVAASTFGLGSDEQKGFMMAMARWLVRTGLAIVLFVPACSALIAISLLAMYADRRLWHSI